MIGTTDTSKNQNYSRGIMLYDHGLYTEAIAEFERALNSTPDDNTPERRLASFYMGEAYANLGMAHLKMNMYRRAEDELKFALVLHPEYADLRLNLAVVYYKQGNFKEAESHIRKAIEANPRFARAHMYLGLTKLRSGDERGFADLGSAVAIEPTYGDDKYEHALNLYSEGDADGAFAAFEEVAETDTDQISFLLEKGVELIQRNMHREACSLFQDAISICPEYADLKNYLGQCYAQLGMFDQAVEQFCKAIEINPRFAAAYLNLASAHEKDGRMPQAIETYRNLLQFEPENLQAQEKLYMLDVNL